MWEKADIRSNAVTTDPKASSLCENDAIEANDTETSVCSEHNVITDLCNVSTGFEDTLVSQLDKDENGNIIKNNIVSQSSRCF